MSATLAIDYGTAFTTAALNQSGRIELLSFGGSQADSKRLPSLVWVDEGGELVIGWAAEEGAALAPERLERSPKQHLGEAPLELGRAVPATEAAAAVLRRVAEEARRHLGRDPERVFLTHPASWPNKRKAALREAATQAGLARVELVPEPVAAARHLASAELAAGASVAVYDLGGGTFDAAVLRRKSDGDFETLAVGGQDSLGGEIFDARLARYIGQGLAQSDPADWEAIARSPRALASLRRSVRQAKEALSYEGAATVVLPEAARRSSVRITRAELERLLEPEIRRSVEILEETVAAAGAGPDELQAVYLAGGASRMPQAGRLLAERFGRVPDTREDPKSVVVLGAAVGGRGASGAAPEQHGLGQGSAGGTQPEGRRGRDGSPRDGRERGLERGGEAVPSRPWWRRAPAVAGMAVVLAAVAIAALVPFLDASERTAPDRGTDTGDAPVDRVSSKEVRTLLASYAAGYSGRDMPALEKALAPRFQHRWAADRSRDRGEELAYYEQEAARDTRFTQRVVSVKTSRRGADAVTRWAKEGRTGGYVLEPGTPTQEAGGMTSEFRGQSRFRLVRSKGELVIRSVRTTYDLRLPVCAPPSKCANTSGARGSVLVSAGIESRGRKVAVTRPATFRLPKPKMRILYIPLNSTGQRRMRCDSVINVRKRYRLLGEVFTRTSIFRWCPR